MVERVRRMLWNTPKPSMRGERIKVVFILLFLAFVQPILCQDKVDPRPLPGSLFYDTVIYDRDFHKHHFIRFLLMA
ncbi:MAG: hypothetical protein ACK42Z_05295 [Candidatus Kapaibacteriota bacterium]